MRIPNSRWWSVKGGMLSIEARKDRIGGNEQPSVWARRQQHMNATVSTTVRFEPRADGDKAGLVADAERRLLLVRRSGPRWRQDPGAGREADRRGRSRRRRRGG
ncbi:hypothetical protein ACRAWD_14005 [Caulobacter segnis]